MNTGGDAAVPLMSRSDNCDSRGGAVTWSCRTRTRKDKARQAINVACCFAVVLCLASCATQSGGYIVPGESLDRAGKYHIVVAEEDRRLLYLILRDKLALRGISVTTASNDEIPQDLDFLVEYGSQWQWDLSWYLYEFNVRIYRAETKLLVASASSVRASLNRKPPAQMVDEVVFELFGDPSPNETNQRRDDRASQ